MKLKKSIVAMALVASMICGSTMNLWAAEMTVKNTAVQYEEITDVEELTSVRREESMTFVMIPN